MTHQKKIIKFIFAGIIFFCLICSAKSFFVLICSAKSFFVLICSKPQNDYFLNFESAQKVVVDAPISPRKAKEIAHLFYKEEYGSDTYLDLFYIRHNDYYFLRKTKNHTLDGAAVNIYSGEVKRIWESVFYNAPYSRRDQKRLFELKE